MLLFGDNTIKALGQRDGGWDSNIIIMHFFRGAGKILHTLGLKVHKFMGSLSTAKH